MIKIDTRALKAGAKNVEGASTILGRDAEIKLSQAADRLKAGWSGDAANTYIQFLNAASEMAYQYQTILRDYADTMQVLASEIDRANENVQAHPNQ